MRLILLGFLSCKHEPYLQRKYTGGVYFDRKQTISKTTAHTNQEKVEKIYLKREIKNIDSEKTHLAKVFSLEKETFSKEQSICNIIKKENSTRDSLNHHNQSAPDQLMMQKHASQFLLQNKTADVHAMVSKQIHLLPEPRLAAKIFIVALILLGTTFVVDSSILAVLSIIAALLALLACFKALKDAGNFYTKFLSVIFMLGSIILLSYGIWYLHG